MRIGFGCSLGTISVMHDEGAAQPSESSRPTAPRVYLGRRVAMTLWCLGIVLFSIGFVNGVIHVFESHAVLTPHGWFRFARNTAIFAMCECGFFARLYELRAPARTRVLVKATHVCFALTLLFHAAYVLSRPEEE